jgi:hypothetical protein
MLIFPQCIAVTLAVGVMMAICPLGRADAREYQGGAMEAATPAPRLVVVIVVDQFSADLFAEYRQHFSGGFSRLLDGAVFPSAFQSHAATETCPGHSTILTGVHPSRSGIVANTWYDMKLTNRPDHRIYCAEDEGDPASTGSRPVVSAVHLRVPTLGEYMKRADARSRNVAVSAKDRAVAMLGGHAIDAGYWFGDGRFQTFSGRQPSRAVAAVNARVARRIASGERAFKVPGWCSRYAAPIRLDKAGVVGDGRFDLPPGDPQAFQGSPRMDKATLLLALRLFHEMRLGRRSAPDLLSISLSVTDYVAHAKGTGGQEMCIQIAELDRSLGWFLRQLDATGIDYQVMLTADHGGLDLPERLAQRGLPDAKRVDPALWPRAIGEAIAADLGITTRDPLLFSQSSAGDIYISNEITPLQRASVIATLVARLRANPEVAAVFTSGELAAAPVRRGSPQDWSLLDRARANFDPERSGDVIVLLARDVVPISSAVPGMVATHGSAWDYDRRVPLLFWRKRLAGFEQPAPVETVDIAPTLAASLGLRIPAGSFDGRCLDIDGSNSSTRQ